MFNRGQEEDRELHCQRNRKGVSQLWHKKSRNDRKRRLHNSDKDY